MAVHVNASVLQVEIKLVTMWVCFRLINVRELHYLIESLRKFKNCFFHNSNFSQLKNTHTLEKKKSIF